MKNELAKSEEKSLAIAQSFGGENVSPVTDIPYPLIKMGKDDRFELDIEQQLAKELTGHIVYMHRTKAYFSQSYGGDAVMPDCASSDGLVPDMGSNEQHESETCAECPKNQWGSADNGGKACRDSVIIYILLDGDDMPSVLRIRSTSLGKKGSLAKFQVYAIKHGLGPRGMGRYQTIRVKLSLLPTKINNFDTSVLVIEPLETLRNDDPKLKELQEWFGTIVKDRAKMRDTFEAASYQEAETDDIPI